MNVISELSDFLIGCFGELGGFDVGLVGTCCGFDGRFAVGEGGCGGDVSGDVSGRNRS